MTRATRTLAPSYFDAVYASDADPWSFASSAYEHDKYATTLAALPNARYAEALEIGCSIGVLTQRLASRCERLLAVDAAQAPLVEARRRCAGSPNVRFAQMFAPRQWPAGVFDLIVLSEVVYYLSADDVARLAARIRRAMAPRGDIVLVHWTGETDYPLTGDEAAELFIAGLEGAAKVVRRDRHHDFRLDALTLD
jgi:cyclopropane fatty-acyl-phospholipid synthase-like methyltransferase